MRIRAVAVPTSSAARSTRRRGRGRDGRGAATRAASTTSGEVPLADGGEGTLDALLAARGGSRRTRARHRAARRSGRRRVGRAARRYRGRRDGAGERARARRRSQRPAPRVDTRGTGELIADRAARAARARVIVGVGGSAYDRRRARRGRDARLVARRDPEVTVACDVATRVPRRGARVFGPQKGATRRAGRAAHAPARAAGRRVPTARTGVDVRDARGRRRRRRSRRRPGRDRRAARARLRRGRRRRRARGRARRRRRWSSPARASSTPSSFEGKIGRRRARVGGRRRRPAPRGDRRPGHAPRRARSWRCARDVQVLALTDRVWQGGEAFAPRRDPRRGGRARGGAHGARQLRSGSEDKVAAQESPSDDR